MTTYPLTLLIIEIICMLIGTTGNGLVLVVYTQRSVKKSPAVILTLFLTCGNLLYSMVVTSLQIVRRVTDLSNYEIPNIKHSNEFCQSFIGVLLGVEYFVIWLNVLIAINRHRIICGSPGERMKMRTVYLASFLILLSGIVFGTVMGVLSTSEINEDGILVCRIKESVRQGYKIFIFGTVFGTIVGIIVLDIKMIRSVKRRQRQIFPLQLTDAKANLVDTQCRPGNTLDPHQELVSQSKTLQPVGSLPGTSGASVESQHRSSQTLSTELSRQPSVRFQMNNLSKTPQPVGTVPGTSKCPSSRPPQHVGNHSTSSSQSVENQHRSSQTLPAQVSRQPSLMRFQINNFQHKTLYRMTKSLLTTTLTFAIIWLCIFSMAILQSVLEAYVTNYSSNIFLFMPGIFFQVNHIIPPFILWCLSSDFRQAFWKLVHPN